MKIINNCLVCNKDEMHIAVDAMTAMFMDFVNAFNSGVKDKIINDPKMKDRAIRTTTRISELAKCLTDIKTSSEGWPKKCTYSCPSIITEDYYNQIWSKDPEFVLDLLLSSKPSGGKE